MPMCKGALAVLPVSFPVRMIRKEHFSPSATFRNYPKNTPLKSEFHVDEKIRSVFKYHTLSSPAERRAVQIPHPKVREEKKQ